MHAAPLFNAPFAAFVTGRQPASVEVADLDHDGRPDVVLCNPLWNSVSLLRGAPGRTFTPATELATAAGPSLLRIADLEPDGFEDLVVACTRAHALSVLRGRGSATFERGPDTPLAGAPIALALLHADVDSLLDAATIEMDAEGNTDLGVMHGSGDGRFAARTPITLGGGPLDVLAVDIEADGTPDLAVLTESPSALVLLHGDGHGAFVPESIPLDGSPSAWTLHPLPELQNGAAVEFYVATSQNLFGTPVRWLRRIAAGSSGAWSATAVLLLPSVVLDLAMIDANHDARDDVLTLGAQVEPLLAQGMTFTYAPLFDAGAFPRAMRVADLDGDGHDDVITACEDTEGFAAVWGQGDAAFGPQPLYTAVAPRALGVADVNGDGIPDVVVPGGVTPVLAVHLGLGNGSFAARYDFPTLANITDAALADVNADNRLDFVAVTADAASPAVVVQLGDGYGNFAAPLATPLPAPATALAVAHFDAGPQLDVAVALLDSAFPADGGVLVLHGRGDGRFDPGPRLDVGPLPAGIVAADFDADGAIDIAASFRRSANALQGGVTVWHGAPGGFDRRTDTLTGYEPRRLAAGELDGQAGAEIVVAQSAFGRGPELGTVVVLHDAPAATSVLTTVTAGFRAWAPVVFDADGDGTQDVAVANAGAFTVSVWLGDGDGGLGARADWGAGPLPIALQAADLDQDGRLDLVTANGGASTATVLRQLGTVTPVAVQDWSVTPTPAGASIEWRLGGDASALRTIDLQRQDGALWTVVQSGLAPARSMRVVDAFPAPAYRLRLVFASGAASDAGPFPGISSALQTAPQFAVPEVRAGQVQFRFTLPRSQPVRLAIYNVHGARLCTVADIRGAVGWQTVTWDRHDAQGARLARGLYWVRLEARDGVAVQRLVLAGS